MSDYTIRQGSHFSWVVSCNNSLICATPTEAIALQIVAALGAIEGEGLACTDAIGFDAYMDHIIAEDERLARIEQAARAHLAEWDSGDTSAHETRQKLREALEVKA